MNISESLTHYLTTLTTRPGVYSMLDAKGKVLYVGKAKNLKKRVSSYFHRQLDTKTLQLVKHIDSIQVTITRNEREAFLLECNLIQTLLPRYNVIFKDDKSYPYLYLSTQDTFPRLSFQRGKAVAKGKYFGPYPSARLAREALYFLQRIFKLRQCDNSFFNNRSRPCLQYQIKRCTAPCVHFISEEEYRKDVNNALLFLEGKSQVVISTLGHLMETKAGNLEYEEAAKYRDQIALLKSIQEQQIILDKDQNIDVLGVAINGDLACVHMLMIREGKMMGTRHYFPKSHAILAGDLEEDTLPEQELLEDFIMQHYSQHQEPSELPKEILIETPLTAHTVLEELLMTHAQKSIAITLAKRGVRLQWMNMAKTSAAAALKGRLYHKNDLTPRFEALQEALTLDAIPQRLECFDVSHTQGEATVASCVVFDQNGPVKAAYRRFNIRGVTPSDDYGALRSALTRHYTHLKSEGSILPDILLIDGGKGQLKVAKEVLTELQVTAVSLMGIAKGPTRKPGRETLYITSAANGQLQVPQGHSNEILTLSHDSPALHLIQQIRDEAHRFAITAHRKQRAKRGVRSKLEEIPGIGKQRRLILLRQFGGLQEVLQASVEELAKVPGINKALAGRIYLALHGE